MRSSESGGRTTEDGRRKNYLSAVIRHLSGAKRSQSVVEQGLAISLLILGVILRIIPHPPNFAPISAIALFGGVYLPRPYAIILPLLSMFASDMIGQALGLFAGFHRTVPAVYGSFVLIGLIGLYIRRHKSAATIVGGALLASILFFLITNLAVWQEGFLYPKTWSGLVAAYAMGLPFFRNTLLGDLFYTGVLFGTYEIVRILIFKRQLAATR
jgi:hypothetical protein